MPDVRVASSGAVITAPIPTSWQEWPEGDSPTASVAAVSAIVAVDGEFKCTQCGCASVSKGRCAACRATAVRISRVSKQHEELFGKWDASKLDNKIEFYNAAKELYGDKLLNFMECSITEETTETDKVQLVGTGEYLDQTDLAERYKAKPERLEALLRNAKRFTCQIAETEMIEDMTYVSSTTRAREHRKTTKRQINVTEKIKAKKLKVVKAETENVDPSSATPLSEAQGKQANNMIETFSTNLKKFDEAFGPIIATDAVPAWVAFLPPYLVPRSKAVRVNVQSFLQELAMAKTDGCVSFGDIKRKSATLKKELHEQIKKVKLQSEAAQEEEE